MNILFQKSHCLLFKAIIIGILIRKVFCGDCEILSNVITYFGESLKAEFNDLTNCCQETGIECDTQNNIIGIKFSTISIDTNQQPNKAYEELGKLLYLKSLEITNISTKLNIGLPACIGNLKNLETLILSNNHFDYSNTRIPNEIGNLSKLVKLDLSNNSFNGPFPNTICQLTNLKHLNLSGNDLEGTFPSECENLTELEYLNLKDNLSLTGDVPAYPNLTYCQYEYTCPMPGAVCTTDLYYECKKNKYSTNTSTKIKSSSSSSNNDDKDNGKEKIVIIWILLSIIGIVTLIIVIKKSKKSENNNIIAFSSSTYTSSSNNNNNSHSKNNSSRTSNNNNSGSHSHSHSHLHINATVESQGFLPPMATTVYQQPVNSIYQPFNTVYQPINTVYQPVIAVNATQPVNYVNAENQCFSPPPAYNENDDSPPLLDLNKSTTLPEHAQSSKTNQTKQKQINQTNHPYYNYSNDVKTSFNIKDKMNPMGNGNPVNGSVPTITPAYPI